MEKTALSALRGAYREERSRIEEDFLRSLDGKEAVRCLSACLDRLILEVCEQGGRGEGFTVLGIGGYGRRELYPHSDVDLLFLHRASGKEAAEKAISSVLHDLWDLQLHLGQQVCSVEEMGSLESDDQEFVLALLDARWVAGVREPAREVTEEIFPAFLARSRRAVVRRILSLTEARHESFRRTIYQLEPDLKEAPGGLRDHLVGKWLTRIDPREEAPPVEEGVLEDSHDFLRRLRVLVHYLSGRNQNTLTHRLQEQVGRRFGYREVSSRLGVESLMKSYFLNARVLNSYCLRTMEARREGPPPLKTEPAKGERLDNLEAVLELFRRSLQENRPLSAAAGRAVVKSLTRISRSPDFPTQRERLLDLMKPRRGLYRVLSEMYELGVLELLFPEFGSIKACVIRDFYHRYTVDEHSLLAIRNLESLLEAEEPSDFRFRNLLQETSEPELLTIALLLHDVGKSREGNHTNTSARMASRALRRFRFPAEAVDLVTFLIRNHLAMSSVIFRRDLEDTAEIRRFADLVNDTIRLKMLCLLTFADVKAVAPGTLNDWKKDLLWQLYVGAYRKLTVDYGEDRIAEEEVRQRLTAAMPDDLDRAGFDAFLEGLPRRYLRSAPPEEIFEHYRLARELTEEGSIGLRLSDQGRHYDLCVVTSDRHFLFSKIAGVLSYFDMNILRGYGFTNRRKTVLDFFQFSDTRDVFRLNPGERERFEEALVRAIRGEIELEKLLASKESSIVFRSKTPGFPPTLHFEQDPGGRYSILEIVAPDAVGLLYRIGRALAELRCDIELVLISTEGNRAVDVFYLTRDGSTLTSEVREALKQKITEAIG